MLLVTHYTRLLLISSKLSLLVVAEGNSSYTSSVSRSACSAHLLIIRSTPRMRSETAPTAIAPRDCTARENVVIPREFSDRRTESALRSPALNRTIAVIAAVIMLLRIAQAMFLFSNTVDEPFHIASAVVMYDVGKESSGVEQPPLTRIVAGLPLYL